MMAWTQADLDALDTALLDDTLEVQFADGRKVRKQTKADMISLRKMVADAIGRAGGGIGLRTTVGRVMRR